MRIGFIIPVDKRNYHPFRNQPLGVLYLLTILREEFGSNVESTLIDLRGVEEKHIAYHVPEKDVYFYSAATSDWPEAKATVGKLREIYPRAKHIGGGPYVELFAEEARGVFDSISIGYGEENIKHMIADEMRSALKKLYRQQSPIDINAYPFPSRSFLPKSAIAMSGLLSKEYSGLIGTNVLFSRGCPFDCHFCANITKGKTQYRSPALIKEEILYLKREYGVQALALKDDQSIPVNNNIARKSLQAIAETGVKWRGQSRANGVSLDMIKLAREAGCVEVAVGIESVSQKSLDIVNKRIDFQKARQYLANLKNEGIDTRLLLIIGLPGEPRDVAARTIEFIEATEPTSVLLSLLCPQPGTELFKNPDRFGIKLKKDVPFEGYTTAFGRFDENEKPALVFEYAKTTPFGESLSNAEILNNYNIVQKYLRENRLNNY